MAHTRSALKQARQNIKRRIQNRVYRSTARTYIKRTRALIEGGDLEQAQVTVRSAIRALDKAAQKGVIHKKNAARRKSRLMRLFNRAQSPPA